MRRILVGLVLLLVAAVALPPLWFQVFPADPPPELARGDRRIPVGDGVEVSAVLRGGGKPVVLVHGLPGCGHDWRELTAVLSRRGHRVIAYDRVGYGHSDPRPDDDFTIDANARELLALIEGQDLHDATVVGWSYGGAVAIRAARLDDARIGRLVLVASAGYWPDAPGPPLLEPLIFSAPVMAWLRAVPPAGDVVRAAFSAQAFGDEPMPEWWLPQLAANFAMPHTATTNREESARMTWGESLDAAPVERPILVIHGDADRLVPLEVARQIDARAPQSQLYVVEGGSHMLPVTHADEIAKLVAAFVLVR
ncbi:MAG TPA: alpha/beta hydrolase [Myxococcota bacterium]|nr:alpha/beta hydrolase [Myxococcota bacterium]